MRFHSERLLTVFKINGHAHQLGSTGGIPRLVSMALQWLLDLRRTVNSGCSCCAHSGGCGRPVSFASRDLLKKKGGLAKAMTASSKPRCITFGGNFGKPVPPKARQQKWL